MLAETEKSGRKYSYEIGSHPLCPSPLGGEVWDLSVGRTIGHTIARLAKLASRAAFDEYAEAWFEEAEDIDLHVTARCDRNGDWTVASSILFHGQEEERARRQKALGEHLRATAGAYEAVLNMLRRRGRFTDDRDISARKVVSLLRPFLATGGRLLVRPDGRPEVCPDINLLFSHHHDPETIARSDRHMAATRAIKDIPHRWRSHEPLKRIARMLGNRLDNGWVELPEHSAIVRQSAEIVAC